MKKVINILLICIALVMCNCTSFAQGIVQSVTPNQGIPGQTMEIVIRATGSQFLTGSTNVSFGDGIAVNYVNVSNSLTLRVGISIQQGAASGPRTITVNSGIQQLIAPSAFTVISSGGQVQAILEIVPTQTIYASDFDPNNPLQAPLLFKVTVMNDNQQRNLKVVFSLILEQAGLLGKATKRLTQTVPNSLNIIDNRNFDSYEFSPESQNVAQQVQSTGMLPAGNYTYRIEVFDEQKNVLLASAEAQNTLTNQSMDLVIIAPGSSLDFAPDVVPSAQPLFQWLSSANQFDLLLFKVTTGQNNTQQIIQQQPIFKEFGITSKNFMYPLSAAKLEVGSTYAWMLRAYTNTASGNLIVESPLYWFSFGKSDIHTANIVSFRVIPESATINTGGTYQFRVEALDSKGNVIPVNPVWKIAPSSEGSINSSGLYKAGIYPKSVAVIAEYGGLKDYALVTVNYAMPVNESGFNLLYELFGNPANLKTEGNNE
jgi:hypothetical protein